MRDGFIKVAAVTPKLRVADCKYNGEEIRRLMREAAAAGAKLVVFPELCITGYSCGDLFLQETLLAAARAELMRIADASKDLDALFFVGLPLEVEGKLYNAAAAVTAGRVCAFVPKTFLPNYNEFYELRHFVPWKEDEAACVFLSGEPAGENRIEVIMAAKLVFTCDSMPHFTVAAEICEDLWAPNPPGVGHALAGANIIVNLSASDEVVGKADYRKALVSGQSARLVCGYVYASAGPDESTQDVVFGGHDLIAENGHVRAESRFAEGIVYAVIDVDRLAADRRRMTAFRTDCCFMPGSGASYTQIPFQIKLTETELIRPVNAMPFVPNDERERSGRCEEILMIQALGLKKRLAHTGSRTAVIGISGGLDSTLALLVTVKAFDLLGRSHGEIRAVTMPGFGTTDRTYDNAVRLIRCLGAGFVEVDIQNAVNVHFADIGLDASARDVTYENAQARERTQILMDIANKEGGMVIGTGDLSELALGWATYNGDHMSMYGVNASVPKTLVRHLVRCYADSCGDESLRATLLDVLDTPVSPELLPPEDGQIAQKTEDLVGPYELHDFFLYHMLRFGSSPTKILRLAKLAFAGEYEEDVILKWEKTFYRRFFAQQFKRSCLPDGPKVGSVAVSPRGDLRMPSDACAALWLDELERLG